MRTPKEYISNLKNRIITQQMIEDALYSVNKRAKNYRDEKRASYSIFSGKYKYFVEKREKEMYERKKILLSILKPVCIHKELVGYKRERIYDYDKKYKETFIANAVKNNIVWENSYVDFDTGLNVEFYDIYKRSQPVYNYYLFYMTGNHSFHTPIQPEDVSKYNLPVYEIGALKTYGKDISLLLSVQFIDQLIELIKSKNFSFVQTDIAYYDQENTLPDGIPLKDLWHELMNFVSKDVRDELINLCTVPSLSDEQKKDIEAECKEKIYKIKKNPKHISLENYWYRLIKPYTSIYVPYSEDLAEQLKKYDSLTENELIQEVVKFYKDDAEKICQTNLLISARNQYVKSNYKNWL